MTRLRTREVRIRLTETEADHIERMAELEGVSKSDFVRSRITRPIMEVDEFRRLCSDTQKHVGGAIPRLPLESLVSFVVARCLGPKPSH